MIKQSNLCLGLVAIIGLAMHTLEGDRMRQLLYVSSKSPDQEISIGEILMTSRRNNNAASVTGLLYTDGQRFLQVLEGVAESVRGTFERIKSDPRHRAIVILSDKAIETRQFGDWAMAHRLPTDAPDTFDDRLAKMLAGASADVRGTFEGLVATRR